MVIIDAEMWVCFTDLENYKTYIHSIEHHKNDVINCIEDIKSPVVHIMNSLEEFNEMYKEIGQVTVVNPSSYDEAWELTRGWD